MARWQHYFIHWSRVHISISRATKFSVSTTLRARALLMTAHKLAPRQHGVHILFGTFAAYSGELQEAPGHFDAVQGVDPLFPAIRANRGVAYYFAGRFDDVKWVFLELLTEYPQRTALECGKRQTASAKDCEFCARQRRYRKIPSIFASDHLRTIGRA